MALLYLIHFLTAGTNMLRKKERITHKHYFYSCLFNNVYIEERTQNCSLDDQRKIYGVKTKKHRKKRLFYCITVKSFVHIAPLLNKKTQVMPQRLESLL